MFRFKDRDRPAPFPGFGDLPRLPDHFKILLRRIQFWAITEDEKLGSVRQFIPAECLESRFQVVRPFEGRDDHGSESFWKVHFCFAMRLICLQKYFKEAILRPFRCAHSR